MIVFVTGGASCGKSRFAEGLCTSLGGNLVYLAAMRPFGEEGARRVERHRALRAGKGFATIECYEGLDAVLQDGRIDGSTALLECVGNVAANALFADDGPRDEPEVLQVLESEIEELAARCAHLVIVGNELGADGVDYGRETRVYQQVAGALSQHAAALSDCAVECCSGVPVMLKGTRSFKRFIDKVVV